MGTLKFSSQVLAYFYERRGFGRVEHPDGIGAATKARLAMEFSLGILNDRIVEIRYQCPTCVVAIAACSVVVEFAQGKSIDEAMALTPKKVSELLGGIPEERFDRCELAVTALQRAVIDARTRKKENIHESRLHIYNTEQPQDS